MECHTDGASNQVSIFDDVIPRHRGSPRGGLKQGREHAHCCALAGSVGSKETKDFALPNFEVNPIDCFDNVGARTKVADQTAGENRGVRHKVVAYK